MLLYFILSTLLLLAIISLKCKAYNNLAMKSYCLSHKFRQPKPKSTRSFTLKMSTNIIVNNALPSFPDFLYSISKNSLSTTSMHLILILIPNILKNILYSMYPSDLIFYLFFQLSFKRFLKLFHKLQKISWKLLQLGSPIDYEKSILGFFEDRAELLAKLMGINYISKILLLLLTKLGFRIQKDFSTIIAKVSYLIYTTYFVDMFKSQFLHTFLPSLVDNRRQTYVVNRFSSVVIWFIGILITCEVISTFLKVPLSSTLALGGFGGLALGLSARDVAANFLGGMLLLVNEPFTPGDMVTFRTGSTELIGRVERVGWGQTRIRGRDTRPTYIPNSHFVQTAVTNMERITHRKFEARVSIRYQDQALVGEVVSKIKDALRSVSKLDVLSQPFRVSFVEITNYSLVIEVVCYFATKSIDEFLSLQQSANIEILRAVQECNAQLALPLTQIHLPQNLLQYLLQNSQSNKNSNTTSTFSEI